MVLSFTCSLSVATAGESDVRTMLIGAIGCNLAWGIVDAVMYLMSQIADRGRELTTLRTLRSAASAGAARDILAEVIPTYIAEGLEEREIDRLRERVRRLPVPSRRPRLEPEDYRGALSVFLLVF